MLYNRSILVMVVQLRREGPAVCRLRVLHQALALHDGLLVPSNLQLQVRRAKMAAPVARLRGSSVAATTASQSLLTRAVAGESGA